MEHKSYVEKTYNLGKADLHIHTNFSDAKQTVEELLRYVQDKTTLNVIAITDHDTIKGALFAEEFMAKNDYRFELIVGEEISCKEGHVIGLFLKKAIEPGLSAHEALVEIKKQGGITVMPHPVRHVRANMGKKIADGVGFMTLLHEKRNIDAIEGINATPTLYKDNLKAMFLNDSLLYCAEVGGSDAHILEAIGMGYTVFEGTTVPELKKAILSCQTRACNSRWDLFNLFKYLFFFLPIGFRLFVSTLIHGRRPKRPQIVNFPKSFKVFQSKKIKGIKKIFKNQEIE